MPAGLAVGYAGLIRVPFFLAGGVALQGLMAVAEANLLRAATLTRPDPRARRKRGA